MGREGQAEDAPGPLHAGVDARALASSPFPSLASSPTRGRTSQGSLATACLVVQTYNGQTGHDRTTSVPTHPGSHTTPSAAAAASDGQCSVPFFCPVSSSGPARERRMRPSPSQDVLLLVRCRLPPPGASPEHTWPFPVSLSSCPIPRRPPAPAQHEGPWPPPGRSARWVNRPRPRSCGLCFFHAFRVLWQVGEFCPAPPISLRTPDQHLLTQGRRHGFILSIQRSEAGAAGDRFKGRIPRPSQASGHGTDYIALVVARDSWVTER